MKNENNVTNVVALGGLGEVGKNMYLISHQDEIIIIDAGVMFPEDELLGIDYVIQDVTYLKQNESKIKALVITHGHEDHIGGISFLLQNINIPVIYAPKIAADLINLKLVDRNVKYDNIIVYNAETEIKTKYFRIEFINTTHSIPDSYAIAIHSPQGTILTTGDFKIDLTPIGPMSDLHKLTTISKNGIKLLLSDSTNALDEGYSGSESTVDEALNDIIASHLGRVIIATFASNIYRVKHIAETCRKNGRKILFFGRSMENAINIALNNDLITDKTLFIDANQAKDLRSNQICILCTGSQGEPLAALSRIANGSHKQITLQPEDLVIFSSSPIPGNRVSINRIINKLYLKGVKVYTNSQFNDIHSSGHAKQEELKLLLRLVKPEYFLPVHGEYRMLKKHGDLGVICGIPKENTFILKNGEVLNITNDKVERGENITAGDIYVDGSRIGQIGSQIIKDRKLMSRDGILITIINLNSEEKKLLLKPNITTRGFIMVNDNTELIHTIEDRTSQIINNYLNNNSYNYIDLKNQIILDLLPYITELTGRRPIIVPLIMDIKKTNV